MAMPRKHLIRTADHPYHVVSRSRNKDWYQLPMSTMWSIAMSSFEHALNRYPVFIHAFVLMSNHYHLLVSTPEANIDCFMFEFNRTFSGLVRERTGRINQIFGGRYKWSLVKDDRYLSTVYRYIYRNPCDAGLVSKAEDYRYSTLYPTAVFPFDLVNLIEATQEEQIRFFNEDPRENERINISKGMRKKYFSAPVERSSRKQYQLPTLAC